MQILLAYFSCILVPSFFRGELAVLCISNIYILCSCLSPAGASGEKYAIWKCICTWRDRKAPTVAYNLPEDVNKVDVLMLVTIKMCTTTVLHWFHAWFKNLLLKVVKQFAHCMTLLRLLGPERSRNARNLLLSAGRPKSGEHSAIPVAPLPSLRCPAAAGINGALREGSHHWMSLNSSVEEDKEMSTFLVVNLLWH